MGDKTMEETLSPRVQGFNGFHSSATVDVRRGEADLFIKHLVSAYYTWAAAESFGALRKA
jgi:hypothetical protein